MLEFFKHRFHVKEFGGTLKSLIDIQQVLSLRLHFHLCRYDSPINRGNCFKDPSGSEVGLIKVWKEIMAKGWLKLSIDILALVLFIYEGVEPHRIMSIIAQEVHINAIISLLEILHRHDNPISHFSLLIDYFVLGFIYSLVINN